MSDERTYTVDEVVARLGLPSADWLKRRLNRKQLPGLRFGRTWRLGEADVQVIHDMHHQDAAEPVNPWGLTTTSRRRVAS